MTNLEAHWFKRVPDGWVFRAPKEWKFGDKRHYLVSDAQKAKLLPLLKRDQFATMGVGCLVGAFLPSMMNSHPFMDADLSTSFLILLTAIAAVVLASSVCYFASRPLVYRIWLGRAARSILEGAPRSNDRFTRLDASRQIRENVSTGLWIFYVAVMLLNFWFAVMIVSKIKLPTMEAAAILIGSMGLFIMVLAIRMIHAKWGAGK
jgi:hypothetical protein